MWIRGLFRLATAMLVALLAAAPMDVGAQEGDAKPSKEAMEEARTRYDRGKELYEEGAYEQSLLEFERAYALAPAYRILYNIAQVAVILRDHPKAIRAYERYLEAGGNNIPAAQRKGIENELKSLYGRVAHITVKVNVDDAEILIDDTSVGTSPLSEPLMVNAGRHVVAARKRGMNPDSESVVLAGTDKVEIQLELVEPTPATVFVPRSPSDDGPAPERPQSYTWVGWMVTGVLTAGAVATGIATYFSTRRLADLRETFGVSGAELDEKQKEARALGITADVLIGSAVLAGAVTLYFTIDELVGSSDGEGDVELGIAPLGFQLRARF